MKTPLCLSIAILFSLFRLNAQTQVFSLSQTTFDCGVTSTITGTFTSCVNFDATHDLSLSTSDANISNVSNIVNGQFTFDIEVNANTPSNFSIQSVIILVSDDPNNCVETSDTAQTAVTSNCILPNDSCTYAVEIFPGKDSCSLISYDMTGSTNTHSGCMSDTTWLDFWFKATADTTEWMHEIIPLGDTVIISVWDACDGSQIGSCLINGGTTSGLTIGLEYFIKLAFEPGTFGIFDYCIWESTCLLPNIDSIPDVSACDEYILPPITGENLTGNESYFSLPGGSGTMYLADDTISSTSILYAYDGMSGCEDEVDFSITIHATPELDSIADTTSCGSLILPTISGTNLSGNESYFDQSGGNGTEYPIGTIVTNSISLFVYDVNNNCSDEDSFDIIIHAVPTAYAGSDTTICEGDSIQLQSSGGIIYSWSPTTGLNDPNISNPLASPVSTTTYTVTILDGNGCEDSDSIIITVNTNPSPIITGDFEICEGDSSLLDAGSGYESYIWSTGDTTQIIVVTLADTYSVTVSDNNGCLGSTSEQVIVNQTPIASAGSDVEICLGDSAQLQASGGDFYLWSPSTGLSDPNIADPISSPDSTTEYLVTVSDSLGCEDKDTIIVTIFPLPEANAGADEVICEGDSVQLMASGGISYSWSPIIGLSDPNIENPIAFPSDSTLYIVSVIDTAGCEDTDSLIIAVNSNPSPIISGDFEICEGDSTIFDAGTGYIDYNWSTGDTTQQIILTTADTYSVTVANTYGCLGTTSQALTINPSPNANAGQDVNICLGDSAQLQATGGINYSWSPSTGLSNPNIANPMANPILTTLYTVIVTDSVGCDDIDSVIINVFSLPIADAGLDEVICEGDSIQLQATGGIIYNWSPSIGLSDPGIANPLAFPVITTTYFVSVVDTIGCESIDSITISVNPNPNPNITGNLEICEGDSTVLDAGNGYSSYLWGNGDTTQQITVTDASTYVVRVTDINGCSGISSATVSVLPKPNANAGMDEEICQGDSVQLQATGGDIYSWTPNTFLSDPNIADPLAFPDSTTNFIVTVSDTSGCQDFDTISITVFELPVANAGQDEEICQGDSVQLLASGGIGYSWSPTFGLSNPGISNPWASPVITTEYFVLVIDTTGCENSDSITITVNSNPEPTITGLSEICSGDTAILDAGSGFNSYTWNNGAITQSISVNEAGLYTVTVSDGNGCIGSDSFNLIVNPSPTANAGNDVDICIGETAQIAASGGISYSWSPPSGLNDPNIFNPIASPTTTTSYTVTVVDTAGCMDSDEVIITVFPLPIANAGPNEEICDGDTVQLQASGGISYSWSPFFGLSDPNIANPTASPTETTVYHVTVTDSAGCQDMDSLTIILHQNPVPSITGILEICDGDTTILDAGPGYINYEWSNGSTNQQVIATAAGIYSVTITDNNGCTGSTSEIFTVNPLPNANAGLDTAICINSSVQLMASGGITYIWSPTNSLNDPNIANPIATPVTTTTYTVLVTDIFGCQATDQVTITVFPLPNANAGPDEEICQGESAFLLATGGVNYSWTPVFGLNNPNIPNPISTPTNSTTYTVLVTDINGCEDTDDLTITVNSNPSPNITGNNQICESETTVFDAGGGYTSYNWSNGATTQHVTLSTSGTYMVTVTNANGCVGTDSKNLIVYPLPMADAGDDAEICEGESVQMQASGGINYVWSPTTGLSNPNIANPIASPTITTTYTVSVTDVHGCESTDEATISVNLLPVADAGPDQHTCIGGQVQLEASGGIIYSWSPTTGLSNPNSQNPLAFPSETTIYIVNVTDINGCEDSDDVTVTIYPNPIVEITGNTVLCSGESSTLDAGPGYVSYIWNTGETAQTIIVNNVGIYSIDIIDSLGCEGTDEVEVTVSTSLNPQITGDTSICENEFTVLNAGSGFNSYLWNTGDTTQNIEVSNGGIYSVSVSNSSGCDGSDEITVIAFSDPIINAGEDVEICAGSTTQLSATGGISYTWNPIEGLSDPNIANPIAAPMITTIYSVIASDVNGCDGSDNVMVTILENPVADAGENQMIPNGASTTLNGNASQGSGDYSYSWSPSSLLVDPLVQNPTTVNLFATQVFTLAVVDNVTGCSDSEEVTIDVTGSVLNIFITGEPNVICEGENSQLIVTPTGGSGTYTYAWTSDPPGFVSTIRNPIVAPINSTTYFIIVNDGFNTAIDSFQILVNPTPVADIGEDTMICYGASYQVCANDVPEADYLWSIGDTTQCIFADPQESTTYIIMVSLENCTESDTVTITVAEPIELLMGSINESETGAEDGSAWVVVNGGSPPYSFLWSNGSMDSLITNLSPDSYIVTITDEMGCQNTGTTIVNPGDCSGIEVYSTITDVLCFGECNGRINIDSITGGTPPYRFQWSNGGTNPFISGLCDTSYTVTIIDAIQCQVIENYTVTEPDLFQIDIQADSTFFMTGGTLPIQDTAIYIDNGYLFVEIIDANGCTAIDSLQIVGITEFFGDIPISIYPNPVRDVLHIEYPPELGKIDRLEIIDIYGRVRILQTNNEKEIDVSEYEVGYYLVRIRKGDMIKVMKVVIVD